MEKLRVALVSTAAVASPGSMRAYADVLVEALHRHAPEIDAQLVELDPHPAGSGWRQRVATLALPWRARKLRALRPDLWHILDGSRAYVASGLRGTVPIVITAHDIIPVLQQRGRFPGAPPMGAAARWLWRRNGAALRKAQAVVCVSASTQRDVAAAFGASASRVVPLPVRPALMDAASQAVAVAREPGIVLHVGNNGFYKNRAQALRIFAALDRTLAQRLVMVGSPPTPQLRGLALELGIVESVDWVEDASDAQIAAWYGRASVLVFPSRYEGFGWPVLEAMTFGLPVVCSNAGSLPEVAGAAAPCLAPDDCEGFVHEIESLLRDPLLHAARIRASRARAEMFGMARFARSMADTYRAVIP